MPGWRCAAMLVMAWALGSGCVSASAQSVAVVIDVTGRVTAPEPVTILSGIAAGARVQIEPGAGLVVIYLKSGDKYSFAGSSQVEFRAGEPYVVYGAKPQKRINPLGNVRIRPADVWPGGVVWRSASRSARIKLLRLADTQTMESSPEFRWQEAEAKAGYRFELMEDTGKSLHEADVTGSSFRLPATVQLQEGAHYTWEVSAQLSDGRRYVSAGHFSIATADLRLQAQALRPAAGAPVSDRVAYAAWLDQMELRDEARIYWKALATERPNDARLKALAAE